jgi:Contractile injection system tube protein/LysM domain
MENTSAAKATLQRLDKNENPVGPGLVCHFNPKEYTLTKANQWTKSKVGAKNMPPLEFSSGEPATLQLELLFDTFEQQKDVREVYTNALWDLMMVDQSLKPPGNDTKPWPPKVQFQWGSFLSFKAAVVNMTQKFTLFLADGTPVRATVNMTLKQTDDPNVRPGQNPTSGGDGGAQVWTVGEGETLLGIAYKVYGTPNKWRRIAEANDLTRVRRLVPGTVLKIPS